MSSVQPVVDGQSYRFTIKTGTASPGAANGTKLAKANFGCLLSGAPINTKYIRAEACAGRVGSRLMAVVADGPKGRIYFSPTDEMELIARSAKSEWRPDLKVTTPCHDIDRLPMYGMLTWGDAFTPRQLVTLTTFSDLLGDVRGRIFKDAIEAGLAGGNAVGLDGGGAGAQACAESESVYPAFALDKMADLGNSLVRWEPIAQCPRQMFGKQAIPMIWDFAEANSLGDSSGSWKIFIDGMRPASN